MTIVQELTEALSLGYVRYLDFEHLDEQNRALAENLRLLRETQNQLVMQEKWATRGDLISGADCSKYQPCGPIRLVI